MLELRQLTSLFRLENYANSLLLVHIPYMHTLHILYFTYSLCKKYSEATTRMETFQIFNTVFETSGNQQGSSFMESIPI